MRFYQKHFHALFSFYLTVTIILPFCSSIIFCSNIDTKFNFIKLFDVLELFSCNTKSLGFLTESARFCSHQLNYLSTLRVVFSGQGIFSVSTFPSSLTEKHHTLICTPGTLVCLPPDTRLVKLSVTKNDIDHMFGNINSWDLLDISKNEAVHQLASISLSIAGDDDKFWVLVRNEAYIYFLDVLSLKGANSIILCDLGFDNNRVLDHQLILANLNKMGIDLHFLRKLTLRLFKTGYPHVEQSIIEQDSLLASLQSSLRRFFSFIAYMYQKKRKNGKKYKQRSFCFPTFCAKYKLPKFLYDSNFYKLDNTSNGCIEICHVIAKAMSLLYTDQKNHTYKEYPLCLMFDKREGMNITNLTTLKSNYCAFMIWTIPEEALIYPSIDYKDNRMSWLMLFLPNHLMTSRVMIKNLTDHIDAFLQLKNVIDKISKEANLKDCLAIWDQVKEQFLEDLNLKHQ